MARRRLSAAQRRRRDSEAHKIGAGVYTVAQDLAGRKLPLPVFAYAPLVYVCEMMAAVICEKRSWSRDRQDHVARYLMAATQEFAVALLGSFDETHFEAWIAAAQSQDFGVQNTEIG